MNKSIGLSPITQPPGAGNIAFLNRPSKGPVNTTDARMLFANSQSISVKLIVVVSITSCFLTRSTLAPNFPSISAIVRISAVSGTFSSVTGPSNRMLAAMAFSAAFLAPLTFTVPWSFFSPSRPWMMKESFLFPMQVRAIVMGFGVINNLGLKT